MEGGLDKRWIILSVFALAGIAVVAAILLSRGDSGTPTSSSASDDAAETSTAEETSTAADTASTGSCRKVKAPEPKQASIDAPQQVLGEGEKATVTMETSCGTFVIDLDTERAPKTTNSFAFLAEEGFYDGLTFHRIAPEFVIQGGDPEGTGVGGPGYKVVEKPPEDLTYGKGVVAMAKGPTDKPGTSGSQFYVVIGTDASLLPEYALIGKVSEGMDVVERIGNVPVNGEVPKEPILIEKATVEKG